MDIGTDEDEKASDDDQFQLAAREHPEPGESFAALQLML
jgi:hypothetical protein